VNTASRLEGLAKEYAAELVVSAEVITRVGLDLPGGRRGEIEIRGKQEKLTVVVFSSARDLPELEVDATAEAATA
jgi:adenylate cyclase